MRNPDPIEFLVIDLFCGAGGTTTGAEMSGVAKVIAAINHDPVAISSHAANHRNVLHMTEDILVADTRPILETILHWKRIYPKARVILWASLECTNFSDAKGGHARDADSRSLANGMFRYLDALVDHIDYFLVENVEEFMAWGPMKPKVVKCDSGEYCPLHYKKGKPGPHWIPESRTAGKDYIRWVKRIQSYGYRHDWRLLCAADYGAVTIRERYFGAFYKPGVAFSWPQRTHAKRPATGTMFADKMKPWRAVAEVLDFSDLGKSIFDRKKPLVDKTLRRILAGLKKFHNQTQIVTYNSPGYCLPTNRPIGTLTTTCTKALLTPILQSYYSGSNCTSSIDQPAPTVPTKDRFALVSPWIDRNFRTGRSQPIDAPAGALLTVPKMNLCTAFIVNPQYNNNGNSIYAPAPTVIATQRSRPLSLATATTEGSPRWTVSDTDTAAMRDLKAFMREKSIADILMRMLFVNELKMIQGFPRDYILHGNQDNQKKFIGNSVETGLVAAWLLAIANEHKTSKSIINNPICLNSSRA